METGLVGSGEGWSPAAGRERQGNAGKACLTQPSLGRNQSSPLEFCSKPGLVAVMDGLRNSWERAGNGEGAQSRAGSSGGEGQGAGIQGLGHPKSILLQGEDR